MQLKEHFPIDTYTRIADVGTGAGVPGIPLKIMFPHMHVVLIEVNQKKVQFLEHIIRKLHLQGITISTYDWRTFLRKTQNQVELVTARASLQPEELIRMFKPSSPYKTANCIYWAAYQWEPSKRVAQYVHTTVFYTVVNRTRKYVMLRDVG